MSGYEVIVGVFRPGAPETEIPVISEVTFPSPSLALTLFHNVLKKTWLCFQRIVVRLEAEKLKVQG